MNYKRTGDPRNGNPRNTKEAGADCKGSRSSLGSERTHAAKLGARTPRTSRPCSENPSTNPRQRGGQASLGLFGCGPSITGRPIRAFQALADDQTRKVGGLTFSQRRARVLTLVLPPRPVVSSVPGRVLSMDELMAKYRRPKACVAQDDTPKATPAMLEAAQAADMREAFPFYYDEESDRRLPTPCGHADIALALEA